MKISTVKYLSLKESESARQCYVCDRKFVSLSRLLKHKETNHSLGIFSFVVKGGIMKRKSNNLFRVKNFDDLFQPEKMEKVKRKKPMKRIKRIIKIKMHL